MEPTIKNAPFVSKQPLDQIVELLERCCVLVRRSVSPDSVGHRLPETQEHILATLGS